MIPQVFFFSLSLSLKTQLKFYSQFRNAKPEGKKQTRFAAYLYSASTQHGNLHPAGRPILFCGPSQEPVLATVNTGTKLGDVLGKKMRVNGPGV